MKEIECLDVVEEEEIKFNITLQKRLDRCVKEAKQRKGRMIG
jgi:hypothetical protein